MNATTNRTPNRSRNEPDTDDRKPEDGNAVRAQVADQVVEQVMRCMRAQLVAMGRDYERCGRAACARSRRCRGFTCDAEEI